MDPEICDADCPQRAVETFPVRWVDEHSGLVITTELGFCRHHADLHRPALERQPAPV